MEDNLNLRSSGTEAPAVTGHLPKVTEAVMLVAGENPGGVCASDCPTLLSAAKVPEATVNETFIMDEV